MVNEIIMYVCDRCGTFDGSAGKCWKCRQPMSESSFFRQPEPASTGQIVKILESAKANIPQDSWDKGWNSAIQRAIMIVRTSSQLPLPMAETVDPAPAEERAGQ